MTRQLEVLRHLLRGFGVNWDVTLFTTLAKNQHVCHPPPLLAEVFDAWSLSGVLCLRHSMSKRSIYANESKNRHGGQGGIAAHFA
jgi:hypothetical protein